MRTALRIIIFSIFCIPSDSQCAIFPAGSSDYKLTTLSSPSLIKGEIMGVNKNYRVLRYEDLAFLSECIGYISLANSALGIPRLYTSPQLPMHEVSKTGLVLKYPEYFPSITTYDKWGEPYYPVTLNGLVLSNESTNHNSVIEQILGYPWTEKKIDLPSLSMTNRILNIDIISTLYKSVDFYKKNLNYYNRHDYVSGAFQYDMNKTVSAGNYDAVDCYQTQSSEYTFNYDNHTWESIQNILSTNNMSSITSVQGFGSAQKESRSYKSYGFAEYEEESDDGEDRIVFSVSPLNYIEYIVTRYTEYPVGLVIPYPLAKYSFLNATDNYNNFNFYIKDCILVASGTKYIYEVDKNGEVHSTNTTLYVCKRITPSIFIDSSKYNTPYGIYIDIKTIYDDSANLVDFALSKVWKDGDVAAQNPNTPTEIYDENYHETSKRVSVTASITDVIFLIGVNYPYEL